MTITIIDRPWAYAVQHPRQYDAHAIRYEDCRCDCNLLVLSEPRVRDLVEEMAVLHATCVIETPVNEDGVSTEPLPTDVREFRLTLRAAPTEMEQLYLDTYRATIADRSGV